MSSLSISSTVKTYPDWPYQAIKDTILGKQYDVSLCFVGAARAQQYNQTYRGKDYVPNVLSFPLTDQIGEIIICPLVARGEAAKFNLSVDGYIAYLFIHGLVHLKGHDHGDAMEKLEKNYLRKFNIT